MVNNYIPNSDLAFIIGDGGLSKASPAPTKVNGQKVNACLETQSTTRSDIFLKPKTDAQINAIQNPTDGMIAFSSDSKAIVVRGNGSWSSLTPAAPPSILYKTLTVNASDLSSFPFPVILDAPGANLYYMVHGFGVNVTGGGTVINTSGAGVGLLYDQDAEGFQTAALMDAPVFENSGTFATADYVAGSMLSPPPSPISNLYLSNIVNKSLSIAPASVYTASGGSSKIVAHIWYSIMPAFF